MKMQMQLQLAGKSREMAEEYRQYGVDIGLQTTVFVDDSLSTTTITANEFVQQDGMDNPDPWNYVELIQKIDSHNPHDFKIVFLCTNPATEEQIREAILTTGLASITSLIRVPTLDPEWTLQAQYAGFGSASEETFGAGDPNPGGGLQQGRRGAEVNT